MVAPWRRALRLLAVAAVLAVVASLVVAGLRGRVAHRGAGWLLSALGIRLRALGGTPPAGSLVVANHVSWLDIVALLAVRPTRLLAKREVADWPVVGTLARRLGTVFIDRGRLRTLPATVATLAAALRAGATVAVFPEGTTTCGRAVGRFRRAAFQAAVDAGAPVQPMTITYRLGGASPATAAAFVGDESLWPSLRRIAACHGLIVEVTSHPPLSGSERRSLAAAARRSIARDRPAPSMTIGHESA